MITRLNNIGHTLISAVANAKTVSISSWFLTPVWCPIEASPHSLSNAVSFLLICILFTTVWVCCRHHLPPSHPLFLSPAPLLVLHRCSSVTLPCSIINVLCPTYPLSLLSICSDHLSFASLTLNPNRSTWTAPLILSFLKILSLLVVQTRILASSTPATSALPPGSRAADFTKEDKTGILEKYKELKHRIQTGSSTAAVERTAVWACERKSTAHLVYLAYCWMNVWDL